MRDLKCGCIDRFGAVEKDIEVDETRTLGERFLATHLRFDVAKSRQEFWGRQFRLGCENGVEKPGLVEIIDGLGFVNPGGFDDVNAGFRDAADGLAQVLFALANVGSQRQINCGHSRLRFYAEAAAENSDKGMRFWKLHD